MYRAFSTVDTAPGPIDNRMIATMRLVLAMSALLIIYLDPSEPDRLVPITYGALALYTLYSATLLILNRLQTSIAQSIESWSHWADVGWYLLLIALSSGTNSIFFFFLFFSILVASFQWGFASGLRVVIVSSVLFTMIGYATAVPQFELNRFLLRPICLVVLGYMMAYWGGYEITLTRRLALLKEVTSLSNPRFGVSRTIGIILERVRAFYDADSCALIITDLNTGQYRLRRADRHDAEAGTRSEPLTAVLAEQLLALSPNYAVIYSSEVHRWSPMGARYFAYDISNNEREMDGQEICIKLASLLDAESLVAVPLRYRTEVVGRVYLTSRRKRAFDRSDADFIIHTVEQIIPVIENIRLVDRLASDAAEQERQRIARDLHDSVIQPYIGLQIGLSAVQQKLDQDSADLRGDLARLIELTDMGIDDLRRYVRDLKEAGEHESSLLPSVRRLASKFAEATDIAVKIEAESDIHVNDRLAAEVFQMIAEGLSNVRRHTHARQATVRLTCRQGQLILQIESERENGDRQAMFRPRSIADRAEALGGQARVEQCDGRTAVIVEIPL